ncbi:MAG: Ig-like domain-containing protein [Treponema sp.]|jgi:hypothetical protein|nr:Ig-like domain-containing protein [Treponema sp.]
MKTNKVFRAALCALLTAVFFGGCQNQTAPERKEQTAAPTVANEAAASAAKTSAGAASVTFTLTSSHSTDCQWKVYDSAKGGLFPNVGASYTPAGKRLTLTKTGGGAIEETDYYVSATESGKTESARLKLTVTAYVPPAGDTPVTALGIVIDAPAGGQALDEEPDLTPVPESSIALPVTVAWYEGTETNALALESPTTAKYDTVYTAVLTITAEEHYSLGSLTEADITAESAAAKSIEAADGSAVITLTFAGTGPEPDTTPPAITETTPQNNAEGVTVSGNIIITFSEAVRIGQDGGAELADGAVSAGTLTAAGIKLGTGAGGDDANAKISGGVYSAAAHTLTLTYAALAYETLYHLTIAGICDLAGNDLASAAICFTTVDALAKTVSIGTPNGSVVATVGGTVSYTVSTANIADGKQAVINWTGAVPLDISDNTGTAEVVSDNLALQITAGTGTAEGTYPFKVTIDGAASLAANFTVLAAASMPQFSVDLNTAEVKYVEGESPAALTVISSANGQLTYRWYSNTAPSTTDPTPTPLDDTDAGFTPPAAHADLGTTYYFVKVTNTLNGTSAFAYSAIAKITILEAATAPNITGNLSTVEVKYMEGTTPAALTVISSANGQLTYQWYSNSTASTDSPALLADETNASFTPPAAHTNVGTTYYFVKVTNTLNGTSAFAYSAIAKITILEAAAEPNFTTNLSTVEVTYTEDTPSPTALTVVTSANGQLTYQWYSNTAPSTTEPTPTPLADETNASFTPPVASANLGTTYYFVKVTNTLNGTTAVAYSAIAKIKVVEYVPPVTAYRITVWWYTTGSSDNNTSHDFLYDNNGTLGVSADQKTDSTDLWIIEGTQDTDCQIKNVATGNYINAFGLTAAWNTNALVSAYQEDSAFHWKIVASGNNSGGYNIISTTSTAFLSYATQENEVGFKGLVQYRNDGVQSYGTSAFVITEAGAASGGDTEPPSELEGTVYRIKNWYDGGNNGADNYMYDNAGLLGVGAQRSDYKDLWYIEGTQGTDCKIKNAATGNYINAKEMLNSDGGSTGPAWNSKAKVSAYVEDPLFHWVITANSNNSGGSNIIGYGSAPEAYLSCATSDSGNTWATGTVQYRNDGVKDYGSSCWVISVVEDLSQGGSDDGGTETPSVTPITPSLVRYEAESGTRGGSAALLDTSFAYRTEKQSEASGRKAVQLNSAGDSVSFTLTEQANAIVLRYCLPDSAGGGGLTSTLSIYKGAAKLQDVELSSQYAWVYGDYPFYDTPGSGNGHRFFDETHLLLGETLPAGTVVKLQKAASDSNYCIIDFAEMEMVPDALSMPANFLSITDYGAAANDAGNDTTAIAACISAASSQGKGVWIPAGTFVMGNVNAPTGAYGVTIRGAGMWHSVLTGAGAAFYINSNSKFYDFAIFGTEQRRIDDNHTTGIEGGGSGVVIENIWIEHTKAGIWFKDGGSGAAITNCRVRNTFADGINLCKNISNTVVEGCSVRNTGDDCIAIWSDSTACRDNTIRNNVTEFPALASGIAVYGGYGNMIENNTVRDIVAAGGGIMISTRHNPVLFSGTTTVQNNVLERAGSWEPNYNTPRGALWFWAEEGKNLTDSGTVIVSGNTINDSAYSAYSFHGAGQIKNVTISGGTVNNTGLADSAYRAVVWCKPNDTDIDKKAAGSVTINDVTAAGTSGNTINNTSGSFSISGSGNSGWSI